MVLGYLLVWQRGYYMDDYSLNLNAFVNNTTGLPSPPVRIIIYLIAAFTNSLLPDYEFLARLFTTVGMGFNALLLGWLVYRILGSRLPAIVSGWLYLMPFFSQEVSLWTTSVAYIYGVAFGLIFIHVFYTTLTNSHFSVRWLIATGLTYIVVLLCLEQVALSVGIVFLLSLIYLVRYKSLNWRPLIIRILLLIVTLTVIAGLFYILFYRNSALVSNRGVVDFSLGGIVERSGLYFQRLQWLTLSDTWGKLLLFGTIQVGFEVLLNSIKGIILLLLAGLVLFITILTWRTSNYTEYKLDYLTGWVTFGSGLIWAVTIMLFPGVLVQGQMLEYRMLYFPMSGLAVSTGAAVWLLLKWFKHPIWERVFLGITGLVIIVATISTIGFARGYNARSDLDQRQIVSLKQAVLSKSQYLPGDTYLVFFDTQEQYLPGPDQVALGKLLSGILEVPWSLDSVIDNELPNNKLHLVVTTHWSGMRFDFMQTQNQPLEQLTIQDRVLPLDKILLLTYQNGRVLPVEKLIMVDKNCDYKEITFPNAFKLKNHGTATLGDVVVLRNIPSFEIISLEGYNKQLFQADKLNQIVNCNKGE
jgi:hypothetical protein